MQGIFALAEELALWTTVHCQPFEPTFVAHALAATRYSGVLTMLALYIASLRYCELYLLLFGIGASINTVVNIILRAIVADMSRASPLCRDVYELAGNWPSFQMQDTAFLVTFVATYVTLYRPRLTLLTAVLLIFFYSFVVAGERLLNYHTTSQTVGAALVGALVAIIWQLFVRLAMPYTPSILRLSIFRFFEYRESLCGPTFKDE